MKLNKKIVIKPGNDNSTKLKKEQIETIKYNYWTVLKSLASLSDAESEFRKGKIAGQVKAYRDVFNILLLKDQL